MTRLLVASVTGLAAAAVSIGTAIAVTRASNFEVGDVGGVLYCYVATPILAFVIAAIAIAILPGRVSWSRAAGVLALLGLGSAVAHVAALRARAIGGTYVVPKSFHPAAMSLDHLAKAVWDRNDAIRYRAWEELERRGQSAADTVWNVIEEARRRLGASYVESVATANGAFLLAGLKDVRVIPVLKDIATTTYVSSPEDSATGRIWKATQLLKEQFGIDLKVKERPR